MDEEHKVVAINVIGTLLTNEYKFYLRMREEEGKPPKQYKEQYIFRSVIAEHWICPNHVNICAKTAAMESTTILVSRTQSTFESSLQSSIISTVTNPLVSSLDGADKTVRITDPSLESNGFLRCRLNEFIDHCPA